jgi:hypothetical protein
MKHIRVVKRYKTVAYDFAQGATLHVNDVFAAWLLNDAPEHFLDLDAPEIVHVAAPSAPMIEKRPRGRPAKR